jgi:hypothetical protein
VLALYAQSPRRHHNAACQRRRGYKDSALYNMIEIQLRQYGLFQELIHHVKRHFFLMFKAEK